MPKYAAKEYAALAERAEAGIRAGALSWSPGAEQQAIIASALRLASRANERRIAAVCHLSDCENGHCDFGTSLESYLPMARAIIKHLHGEE